jgi:ankyrin repeat protein
MRLSPARWRFIAVTLGVVLAGAGTWFALEQRRQIHEYELMSAAAQGDVARIGQLLDSVGVNARFGGDGETALHRAAARGHVNAVRLLLERGANVNVVDDEGTTPLLAATYRGHMPVVKLLVDSGASVNAQEKRHGFTPLLQAVSKNDRDLVELLLKHGADLSAKTIDGRTALVRAEANGAAEIVALLKQAGAEN